MFARLRGVPERHIGKVVEVEIGRLDLKKYADRKCKTYRYDRQTGQVWFDCTYKTYCGYCM